MCLDFSACRYHQTSCGLGGEEEEVAVTWGPGGKRHWGGQETSSEVLECKDVWLKRHGSGCKEFLPLWHSCPGACLKNCLWLCYYSAEDTCPHPAHGVHSPSPPVSHHLTSSSLWLGWQSPSVRQRKNRSWDWKRWSWLRRAGITCSVWQRRRDDQTRVGGQQAIQIRFPPFNSKLGADLSISGKDVILPWNSNTPREVQYCWVNWHL